MTKTNSHHERSEPEQDELTDRKALTVRYEIRVAHGQEAELLRRRQAEAIRALLVWLAERKKAPEQGGGPHESDELPPGARVDDA